MDPTTIVRVLDELDDDFDLGSDISGVSDDSEDDKTYRPKGSAIAESSSSEDEIQDVKELGRDASDDDVGGDHLSAAVGGAGDVLPLVRSVCN